MVRHNLEMCGRPVLAFEVTGQVGKLPLPQSRVAHVWRNSQVPTTVSALRQRKAFSNALAWQAWESFPRPRSWMRQENHLESPMIKHKSFRS